MRRILMTKRSEQRCSLRNKYAVNHKGIDILRDCYNIRKNFVCTFNKHASFGAYVMDKVITLKDKSTQFSCTIKNDLKMVPLLLCRNVFCIAEKLYTKRNLMEN